MMRYLTALTAVIIRNLKTGLRRPDLTVQAIAVPIVVFGLASIMFGATDAWPTAFKDESQTPQSRQLITSLRDVHGARGPYLNLDGIAASQAQALLATGNAQLSLTVPPDFASRNALEIRTYNINTDAMKNVRMRLMAAANLYDARAGHQQVKATITKARPHDVSRTAFMGGSAIILALLLGACLITANLFAMEQEIRTTRELVLTPVGVPAGTLGASTAGIILAILTALPTAAMAVAFGFRTDLNAAAKVSMIVLPAMIAAAGLGALLAQRLRTHRSIQPAIILTALATYFAAGGFIPVPGLPPAARDFSLLWPPSYVFEWCNPILHGFSSMLTPAMAVSGLAAATTGIGLSWLTGHLEQTRPAPAGQ